MCRNELLNIDCMEYMAGCEDNAFDLVVTSPPYNMNLRVNSTGTGYCSRQIVKELSTKYTNFSDNLPMDEYELFLDSVISELTRVGRLVFFNIQIITGNKPALFSALGKHSNKIKEVIVWDKCRAQPAIGTGVMNSEFELIIVFGGNPINRAFIDPAFDRGTLSNIFRQPAGVGDDKNHKASFPVSLVDKILMSFSKPGQSLFDPFLGSGSSAIAAHYFGVDFVGCELDKDYYDASVLRFNEATAQQRLL